jgi:hypothetical protein
LIVGIHIAVMVARNGENRSRVVQIRLVELPVIVRYLAIIVHDVAEM